VPSKVDVRRHAADAVVALEHGDLDAALGQLVGGGQPHRPGADDRHAVSGPVLGHVLRRGIDREGFPAGPSRLQRVALSSR
jgi:hypothetical protein